MKIFASRLIAACLCACVFLICAAAASAQPAVSALSGRVLDQNGEVASGATVTAHNTATSCGMVGHDWY